jgi:hypothetical protein
MEVSEAQHSVMVHDGEGGAALGGRGWQGVSCDI